MRPRDRPGATREAAAPRAWSRRRRPAPGPRRTPTSRPCSRCLRRGAHRFDGGARSPQDAEEVDLHDQSHLVAGVLPRLRVRRIPALLTHTFSGPRSAAAAATSRWRSGSRTSCAMCHACSPSSSAVSRAASSFTSVTSRAYPRRSAAALSRGRCRARRRLQRRCPSARESSGRFRPSAVCGERFGTGHLALRGGAPHAASK